MRRISIIGIGAGDPGQITLQGVAALNRAQVLFMPDKGQEKADLQRLREEICARCITHRDWRWARLAIPARGAAGDDYDGTVERWHERLAEGYEALMRAELGEDGHGAFLVWGDPSLYDSTLRLVERIRARGLALEVEVVPGITALQALTARHAIPLNRIGRPVTITTGRRLAQGWPEGADTVAVMLDGEQAFMTLEAGRYDIWWGAYLGMEGEILIAGRLEERRDEILRARAAARAARGWIMDSYILRRREV